MKRIKFSAGRTDRKMILPVLVVLSLALSSCEFIPAGQPVPDAITGILYTPGANLQSEIATAFALTQAAQPVSQPQQPVQQPQAAQATVNATARQNANCRTGPASNFDWITTFPEGATASVIGRNDTNDDWYLLRLTDGSECWVNGDTLNLSGSAQSVAFIVSPPTPTPKPAPSWTGTWTMYIVGTAAQSDPQTVTTSMVQNGNSVSGTFNAWGMAFGYRGTVSADGFTMTGTTNNPYNTFNIKWVMDPNRNVFRGKWWWSSDTTWDGMWCGARNGASIPTSNCRP